MEHPERVPPSGTDPQDESAAEEKFSVENRPSAPPQLNVEIAQLAERIAHLQEESRQYFQTLHDDLAHKLKKDSTLRDAFDKLYGEMEQYKDNFLRSATKPLVQDLILLFDNMTRTLKSVESDEARQAVENLQVELEEVLYRRDVEKIEVSGDKLDRKRQRAVKTIKTDDPERNGRIVEVVREGFMWEDIVLRPQEVVIEKYKTQQTEEQL